MRLVLHGGAEHLAQHPERVLDRRHADLVGGHLRTHALTAAVFTSTTATSPHCG